MNQSPEKAPKQASRQDWDRATGAPVWLRALPFARLSCYTVRTSLSVASRFAFGARDSRMNPATDWKVRPKAMDQGPRRGIKTPRMGCHVHKEET